MSRTFIFILLMLLPVASRSQTLEWEGVVYEIDTTIGEAKVVKVTNITQKEYPIQESFVLGGHTYPVTSIGAEVFKDCWNMESLAIPKYVVNIGLPMFPYTLENPHRLLSSIEVDPDNPKYDSRNGCNALIETGTNTLLAGCSKTVIPNTATTIAKHAFTGLKELKSLSLPNSITKIEDYAFTYTFYLRDVKFSDSLTFIGDYAFYRSGLNTIELPNTLKHIGDFAFCFCGKSLTLPDSMDYIGKGAFSSTYISSAEFPRRVKSIREWTFYKCYRLTSVTVPETVDSIDEGAFMGSERLSDVTIQGSSLQSIGQSAFKDCEKLSNVNVPNSVKEICDSAFLRCTNLRRVNLPPGLTEIPDKTFSFTGLDSVFIPNSVKRIGKSAFDGCFFLKKVKLPDGLESIEDSTFYWCNFRKIVPSTMAGEGGDSCLVLPPSLKHIGKYAFAENSRLTSVIFPNSLKTIGYEAFSNYTDRHRILKTVVIPAGVEDIGRGAFSYSNHRGPNEEDDLKDIYCYIETPIDSYPFNKQSEKTLHVPAQSVGLYRNNKYWSKFKEIVPLTDEETSISLTTTEKPNASIHYSLSGSRISPNQKGIHLVRYDDGTVRKVICK